MKRSSAEIIHRFGPFPAIDAMQGVSFDGERVRFDSGRGLDAFGPNSGKVLRSIDVLARAGTAFDGKFLYQMAKDRIQKLDP